jgi:hypothetical protein
MTLGKSLALAMGFVVAMALGVWVGPYLTDRASFNRDHKTAAQDVASRQAPKPRTVAKATAPAAHESSARDAAPAVAL